MDFFEKLGKKATETFNSAGEKANKIAGDTKLKLKINDCKSKIKDLYEEIGKIVYQKFVLDENSDIKDDIKEQVTKISELTDQIESYERERLELADKKQCENCKSKIDRSAKFCSECGAEQPEEPAHEVEVVDSFEYEEKYNEGENAEGESNEDDAVAEDVNEENKENEGL